MFLPEFIFKKRNKYLISLFHFFPHDYVNKPDVLETLGRNLQILNDKMIGFKFKLKLII